MLIRVDAISLGATPIEVRSNGSRVYRGRACFGNVVHEYGPSDPGGKRSEFVPAEVALAPEVLRETEGAPFTVVHPGDMLRADDEDAIREHNEGSVLRAVADWGSDPPAMVVDVVVLTASAQEAIESGRIRELSLGYECEDERRPGTFNGRHYDVIQRRRRINHLSAVHTARSTTADGRRARLDAAGAPYAHPGDTMDTDDLVLPAAPHADAPRSDADVVVTEPPAADPMATALAMFSPEAIEILKTLPEADLQVLQGLAVTQQGEDAEQAVIAAAEGGDVPPVEVEEVDDATTPMAPQGLTMDMVHAAIADAIARIGAPARADATAPARPVVDNSRLPGNAPVGRVDAADVARRAAAIVDADRAFVERVRSAGHRCDSVADATAQAMAVIKAQSPGLVAAATRALKEGRRDDFAAMFDAAEDSRRAGHLDDQFAVLEHAQRHVAADRLAAPGGASLPLNFTAPARAVT